MPQHGVQEVFDFIADNFSEREFSRVMRRSASLEVYGPDLHERSVPWYMVFPNPSNSRPEMWSWQRFNRHGDFLPIPPGHVLSFGASAVEDVADLIGFMLDESEPEAGGYFPDVLYDFTVGTDIEDDEYVEIPTTSSIYQTFTTTLSPGGNIRMEATLDDPASISNLNEQRVLILPDLAQGAYDTIVGKVVEVSDTELVLEVDRQFLNGKEEDGKRKVPVTRELLARTQVIA